MVGRPKHLEALFILPQNRLSPDSIHDAVQRAHACIFSKELPDMVEIAIVDGEAVPSAKRPDLGLGFKSIEARGELWLHARQNDRRPVARPVPTPQ